MEHDPHRHADRQRVLGVQVRLAPLRRRRRASIVNISSGQAIAGFKGFGAYGAAKAGVSSLTRTLAVEGAGVGIRAIDPATLGPYVLPGRVSDPRPALDQARAAERLGLGTVWLSERWGTKDFAVLAPTPAVAVAGAIGTLTALRGNGTGGGQVADLLAAISAGDVAATVAWTQRPGLWGARGAFQAESASGDEPASGDAPGAELTVSGSAELILSPEADRVLILADAPDATRTPVLLLVDTAAEGVSVRRIDGLDLLRPLGAVAITGARALVLATGDAATSAVRHGLATAAAALASELVGLAGHCLDGAVGYAAKRHQFGHPIGSFQAVKHICADVLTGVELARAAARHLAGLLDTGADADDLDQAVALALLKTASVAQQASAAYIQILGGISFSWEHEAHLYYRRAGASAPLFGTATAHRMRLDPSNAAGTGRGGQAAAVTPPPPGSPAAELTAQVQRLLPLHLPLHRRKWGDDDSFAARLDWLERG